MIIRSQDKSKITNFSLVSDLDVFKNRDNTYDIIACYPYFAESDCGYTTIATYSTKEKAIEVMDRIFQEFCDYATSGAFNMPSDNEVEV